MILNNRQLINRVVEAIRESGWNVYRVGLSEQKPFSIFIYKDTDLFELNIYIWNLTHGGKTRSSHEYRIQIKERNGLHKKPGAINLLLGWHESLGVFAGFDFNSHINARYSASVQIQLQTLGNAADKGIDLQDRSNGEVAVAFRPDFFMEYAKNLSTFHDARLGANEIKLLQQAMSLENLVAEIGQQIPQERQKVLREINRSVRDSSFRRRVLSVYNYTCAFCGVQLNLVDAAHILPVSIQGSTDETHNGIALCALHHRAYDASLITFDESYRIKYNKTQVNDLIEVKRTGGLQGFLEMLRPMILTPSQDHPKPDVIREANSIRGWENVKAEFVT